MPQTLNENCSYSSHHETTFDNHDFLLRNEEIFSANANEIKEQQKRISTLESELDNAKTSKLQSDLKNAKLQTELDALKEMKASCERDNIIIREFSNKLDHQRN